jgi:pantoate--beta-alanine ligase
MRTVRTIREVRDALAPHRGGVIGLVPTMGAFHAGHLALIRAARSQCEYVVISLFVNPTQFGPREDLDRYPRDEARDAALAADLGIDLLFAPTAGEVYRPGHDTWVEPGALDEMLEGEHRPGHFRGVATICCKLFNIVQPRLAYFGQKDAQQVAVVRRMVSDLDLPLEIRVVPTVRDADGLALSSRNAYLSAADRARALALPRALATGRQAHRSGEDAVTTAERLLEGLDVDYVAVADFDGPMLVAAIRVGDTRLIDNVRLDEESA